ncbi:MAG: hypothetical protein Q4A32_03690 [Lachnospiraceae bacterium]|nr:hypothetical protein [Lachnospiraceae bacterium]
MDIKNIESLDFASLSSEEASELGLNVVFLEEDGTYNWIYCLKMFQNLSMFKFIMKVIGIIYAFIIITMLVLTRGSDDFLWLLGIFGLTFVAIVLIVLFSIWLVDKLYKGNYMLIYEMNEEGITFSQTTDQAQITRTIAATSAAVNAVSGNVGGVVAGSGLAMRPNSYNAKFSKVNSVKGKRSDNLIWVNTFLQYLMVYVPDEAYDFVWNYITERCVNARIS